MSEGESTFYTVVTPSGVQWRGSVLSDAIKMWDSLTYRMEGITSGGIMVETHSGGLMVRDGWILHVHENGVVYLSTRLMESV